MHGLYSVETSWPAVAGAIQAARDEGAAELDSPLLLLTLTRDHAVRDAIAAGGASPQAVEQTAIALPRRAAQPGEDLAIAPATWLVLHRSASAAFAREHVAVEPGHLLLGMLADPASDAARLLADAGADLASLAFEIDERLPGRPFDVAWHRNEAERRLSLSPDDIARLLGDLGEWHTALRSLRERRRAIAAGETPRVADEDVEGVRQHAREHAAWIPLTDHHLHVAIEAADAHAPGHDFGFTYLIALHALSRTCRRYDGPATQANFLRAVRRAIDTALERAFRDVARAAAV